MKVTIWVDWDNQTICSNKKELAEDYENSDCHVEFDVWLDGHYTAIEVWDIDADIKTAIKQEYARHSEDCLADFVDAHYEAIEIEV